MFIGPAPHILRPSLAAVVAALRPQDVFATSLYTGTGAAQTITNGLDLAGKGGLVWTKARSNAGNHGRVDTARGRDKIFNESTAAEYISPTGNDLTSFNNNGFSVGPIYNVDVNGGGSTLVAWSFRRAAKFFDVVTYTGDGTSGRQIAHGLGIKPGMIIIKDRTQATNWPVYHQSIGAGNALNLNSTSAAFASAVLYGTEPTASVFTLGSNNAGVNLAGDQYVAYLFAHDPDTTNGIIQCGGYVSGSTPVVLGWRPQYLLLKSTSTASGWNIVDAARGLATSSSGTSASLQANNTNVESTSDPRIYTQTDGFVENAYYNPAGATVVYCAIRAPT